MVHLPAGLLCSISERWHRIKFLMAVVEGIYLDFGHLITSGAEFPCLPRSLPAHSFIPSVCHFSDQLFPRQHIAPLLPFTFCSPLVLQDSFLSLSCQEIAEAHLTSPWGDVLLFNTRIEISPLSCIHICKFQGVSSTAVGAHLWLEDKNLRAEMVSKIFKAYFYVGWKCVLFIQVEYEGENQSFLCKKKRNEKGRKTPLEKELQSMAGSPVRHSSSCRTAKSVYSGMRNSVQIKIHSSSQPLYYCCCAFRGKKHCRIYRAVDKWRQIYRN